MVDFADLAVKNQALISRALQNLTAVAPSSASPIEGLLDSDGTMKKLPEGYSCVGWLTEDGAELARDIDSDQTTSDGTLATTRSDRTQDDKTVKITMQETNVVSMGLYWDQDLSGTASDANGEFSVASPDVADQREYRVVVFGKDTKQGLIQARFFPRMVVDDVDSEKISTRDNDERGVMLRAIVDEDLGYDMKQFFAAPEAVLTSMGVDTSAMSSGSGSA
jgi:hypothetical protein